MAKPANEYMDHEIRIRMVENAIIGIEKRFDAIDRKFDKIDQRLENLENRMQSQFHWVIGSIITMTLTMMTLFGGIILHMAKLI